MSDIFLSYARKDRSRVLPLVQALERHGWSVWWDHTILPRRWFARSIKEALDVAKVVVVVWSRASVSSNWVQNEADDGSKRDILISVMIEDIRIPLGFRHLQTVQLLDWRDGVPPQEFDKLVTSLEEILGPGQDVLPSSPQIINKRRLFFWCILLMLALLGIIPMALLSKLEKLPPNPEPYKPPYFRNSYALVIGIDKYPYYGRDLTSAVSNAETMVTVLNDQKFVVITLRNEHATKDKIIQWLNTFARYLTEEDRVLVFFTGHGKPGYIVPYDGTDASKSYISLNDLESLSREMGKVKHQLFIIDANFGDPPARGSGGLGTGRPANLQNIKDVTNRFARQILVSGDEHQQGTASELQGHGWFIAQLMEALQEGKADANGDCYVIFQELVDYLRPGAPQTLKAGELPEHNQGEFAFRVKRRDKLEELLAKKAKNLCGLDLRSADLSQIDLRKADLRETDLRLAKLQERDLSGADLDNANLEKAELQNAQLPEAKMHKADLIGSYLSKTNLEQADLSQAILYNADLSQATLGRANLRGAILRDAKLNEADLREADVASTVYEPIDNPPIQKMELVTHLEQMIYKRAPDALRNLREAFAKAGMDTEARQITYAIMRSKRDIGLETGKSISEKFVSFFNILFFEITCQYGMSPGRPMLILLSFIPLFAMSYAITLRKTTPQQRKRAAIWVTFIADRTRKSLGKERRFRVQPRSPTRSAKRKAEHLLYLLRMLRLDHLVSPQSALYLTSWLRVLRISLYFSLFSSFNIGWGVYTIGNWLMRLQTRQYTLSVTGWVRTVSGLQSLIGLYLLALFIRTFSSIKSPFEP